MSTILADSIATPVPAPIAIPTFAVARQLIALLPADTQTASQAGQRKLGLATATKTTLGIRGMAKHIGAC